MPSAGADCARMVDSSCSCCWRGDVDRRDEAEVADVSLVVLRQSEVSLVVDLRSSDVGKDLQDQAAMISRVQDRVFACRFVLVT